MKKSAERKRILKPFTKKSKKTKIKNVLLKKIDDFKFQCKNKALEENDKTFTSDALKIVMLPRIFVQFFQVM